MAQRIEEFTSKPFNYYVTKFRRRLFRRVVEYEVLAKNLERDMDKVTEGTLSILAISQEDLGRVQIKDHVEKACMTGLKAEFELFFTIYCTFVVDHILSIIESTGEIPRQHKGLLKQVKINHTKFFEAFMKSGLRDARGHFIEQAIPKHGLGLLVDLLTNCGWVDVIESLENGSESSLDRGFGTLIKNPWKQVKVAFQVRHAIEHTFSKVGSGFVYHATPIINETTWSRYWAPVSQQLPVAQGLGFSERPKIGDRMLLDNIDIRGTAAAMSWSVHMLNDHWDTQVLS